MDHSDPVNAFLYSLCPNDTLYPFFAMFVMIAFCFILSLAIDAWYVNDKDEEE